MTSWTTVPDMEFSRLGSRSRGQLCQTWSSRDLGLGLVDDCARHGVLETWVLVSWTTVPDMEFSRLGSWSRDRTLKVLVLMPKVSVLKLGLVFWQLNKFGIIMLILKYKKTT